MKQQANSNKQQPSENFTTDENILVGQNKCREMVFPCAEDRPSHRTFTQWRLDGFFPSIKIGRRIYLSVPAVRKALAKRFTIQSVD